MLTFLQRAYAYVTGVISGEPAVVAWMINGGAAMLAAYAFGLSSTKEAAVATIVSAAATAYTALKARPAVVPTAVGALATVLTAAGAFGFHPSADTTAVVTSLASIALALLFRVNLTPVATLRRAEAAAAPVQLTASVGQVPINSAEVAREIAAYLNRNAPGLR